MAVYRGLRFGEVPDLPFAHQWVTRLIVKQRFHARYIVIINAPFDLHDGLPLLQNPSRTTV